MRAIMVILLAGVACRADAEGTEKFPSAVVRRYPSPHRIAAFTTYSVPGLSLWSVTAPSVPDRTGASSIVGVDDKGALVTGVPLFLRASPGKDARQQARLVFDILLARTHGEPLDTRNGASGFATEKEWALIRDPVIEGGVLTFWMMEGEMRPYLTRVRTNLATGEIERRTAHDVLDPPENAIPGIRELLHSKDPARIKQGLGKVGEWKQLAPDVEALLVDPDGSVRSMAISILTNLREPRSIPALIRMLSEGPEWSDRSLAGQALIGRYGTPEAIAAVRAHVARGSGASITNDVYVLREMLREYDAGKRNF